MSMSNSEAMTLPEAIEHAYRLLNAGELDGSRAVCNRVLDVDPGNTNALYILGTIEYQLASYAEAENFLGKALKINQGWAMLHSLYGVVCLRQEKYDRAAHAFENALRLEPDNTEFRLNLAKSLNASNDFTGAKKLFEDVIARTPANVEAYYGLAVSLVGLECQDMAVAAGQEAIKLSPLDAKAHYSLGYIYWKLGAFEQSEDCYRRAIELQPELDVARYRLASSLRDRGETLAAIEEFERLAAIDPDSPDVARQISGTRTLHVIEERATHRESANRANGTCPVFVLAPVGRCGSTLLQRLLNSSREYLIYGENLDVSKRLPESVEFAAWKAHDDNTGITQADLDNHNRSWSAGLFAGNGADYLALALNAFYSVIQHYEKSAALLGRCWGIKEPYAGQLGILRRLLPEAKFIFIYRDLLDVARSYKGRGWLSTEFEVIKLANDWQEGIRNAFLSGPSRTLTLRYEDLVREPDIELGRIGSFLGISDIDSNILKAKINSPDEPYKQPQELTQREMGLLDRYAGGMCRWMGYAKLSGHFGHATE